MQTVVENGVFRIPLYHGTCSAFYESIETLGLGGLNPIPKLGVISFLRELMVQADEALGEDPDWVSGRFLVQWMVDQESFSGGGNFQHGDTYLTPSRASAVGYALQNRFGSELITQAHRVYCLLVERQPRALQNLALNRPLVSLFATRPEPLIVTAFNVAVTDVVAEGGGPPDGTIESLQEYWNLFEKLEKDPAEEVLNKNFRLRSPLAPGSFSIEFVEEGERNPYDW